MEQYIQIIDEYINYLKEIEIAAAKSKEYLEASYAHGGIIYLELVKREMEEVCITTCHSHKATQS